MKKRLLAMMLGCSIAFAGMDTYISEMDSLISDVKDIEKVVKQQTIKGLTSDASLSQLQTKLEDYEKELSSFSKSIELQKSDPVLVKEFLDKAEALSQSSLNLANAIVSIADKTSTNSNDSYIKTLEILTRTTLRLSDDIGVMADRIGEMADRIGEMADRIVYTEELITKHSEMINNSAIHIADKFNFQMPDAPTQSMPSPTMPSMPPSMPGAPF